MCLHGVQVSGQDVMKVSYSFRVEGECGMCQDRIESTAMELDGVISAEWDIQSKIMDVIIDENVISISALRRSIAMAGHDNGNFLAPDEVYDNLHGCCKYRVEADHGADHEKPVIIDNASTDYADMIQGHIYSLDDAGNKNPLIGATVMLSGTDVGTTSNFEGYFEINNPDNVSSLDISYVGFKDKEIEISEDGIVEIILRQGKELDVVEISYEKRTTEVSFVKPINVESITRQELQKAACCNLSESFETNPSVDVSFTDAVTGARQIQMLGLSSPYVQITRELMPDIRAMSSIYGFVMTPGPWVESIQLIKGAGSVVNGYESITGQINVEYKKPDAGEILHVNAYANQGSRLEFNSNFRMDVSPFVSSSVLVHAKQLKSVHDRNDDGFLDMPLEEDFILVNRWKFKQKGNFVGQAGIKVTSLDHSGGSHDHFSGESDDHENHWRMNSRSKRYEFWGKTGYINPNKPGESIGLQLNGVRHEEDSSFGNDLYNTEHNYFRANLIYQSIADNENIFRAGFSYQLDDINERVGKAGIFERYESVPGAFLEYSIISGNKFAIIPGFRVDHHNNYGVMTAPRLHAKYNFSENSIFRLSAGRGWRTASIFAENIGLFSSSREVIIDQSGEIGNPYGLDAESAWNFGINFMQGVDLFSRELLISFDVYRTEFENQIVVDYETAGRVSFYNLDGSSYSNSVQLKLEYPVLEQLDVRAAYRLFDVKTDYVEGRLEKPLISRHRAFVNIAYEAPKEWEFDATLNWNGSKRLPDTSDNPLKYQRPDRSPDFFLFNAQVSKRWGDKWSVYVGGENIFNFQQTDAIIAADDAFGSFFDASIVWAPLFGSNYYIGFRYNLISE